MTAPILAYNNLFESGTVAATEEDPDYLKENAYDWKPFDWWKPTTAAATTYLTVDSGSAVAADYWAVFAHANIDSVQLQESTDNFSSDITDVGSAVTPTGSELIFRTFTQSTKRYRRLKIIHTSVFSLGIAAIGTRIDLPAPLPPGFSPFSRDNKILNSKSGSGNMLGRSVIRNGWKFELDMDLFSNAYMRSTLQAFIDHAEVKPFFFSWNQDSYPDEAAFCELDSEDNSYSWANQFRQKLSLIGYR